MKNKQFKKIIAGLCTAIMIVTGVSWPSSATKVNASESTKKDLKLWYDEAAGITSYSDWEQWSLPVGNSGIGGSVFGGIEIERIQLNEKSLWSGGPAEGRDYNGGNLENKGQNGATMQQIQAYFAAGNDSAASDLCNELVGVYDDAGTNGYGYYLSYGNMYLDFDGITTAGVTNYYRDLDLRTAIASVEYDYNGTHYTRETFVSYPDNVLVTRLVAEGDGTLDFDVRVEPDNVKGDGTNNAGSSSYTRKWTTTATDGVISISGELDDNQMKFSSHTKVMADTAVTDNTNGTVTVDGAKEVTIITSIGTDYKNDYPVYRTGETDAEVSARVLDYVTDASEKSYADLRAAHVADYDEIFSRVELDLGQEVPAKTTDALLAAYNNGSATESEKRYLEVMLFQFGRYLTIESSRETPENDASRATLPSNLQGIWVGANNSAWHADYHMNVNLQMNYWPTYSTNMAECAEPLIAYVDSLREPGRVTAAIYAGIESTEENPENGFMAHTQNNPFGWTCPGWSFNWGWSPAAVPWILQNCWEYYEFTGDVEYMAEYIYPMLKEEAILYDQMLVRDSDGKLVSSPSYSPEHGPRTEGNTYEQTLIWQLYEDTITAAETLGVDADLVTRWKANQDDLKGPIEIGESGQIKEWYNETTFNTDENGNAMGEGYGHRHISHILGLFPGDLIATNDEWLEAARVTMENRTDSSTGWGMGQRINTWARLGDGNKAYKLIGDLFAGGILTNLWDTHAPFQIDGNFGYTSGVAEMLLQSNMGTVNLLPALPDAWADGTVEGLVARGNFEIDMTWANTNLTEATILSKNGGECVVEYPTITEATVVDENGNAVETTVVEGENCISFETEAGKTYTIKEVPEKPLEAPTHAEAIYAGSDAIIFFDELALATEYKVYASTDGQNYTLLATVDKAEYKDTAFVAGKTYKVAAVGENGEGELTDVITPTELEVTNKIDDRDERIKYDGFSNYSESSQYLGTEKYSTTPGAVAEFYFYGNTVRVIGMKNIDCGKFDLYIDGELVADDVNTYNGSCVRQQEFVEIDGLTEGIHKVELVVVTSKVSLDAFEFDAEAVPATGLVISGEESLNMNAATTLQLSASYTPSGATGAGVNWTVDKTDVATIDENGLLTALKVGTVVVTATDKTNADLTATKTITITREASVTKYDDSDAGITYSGDGWVSWGDGRYYQSTGHEIMGNDANAEASFSFTFDGTGIALYGMKLVYYNGNESAGALVDIIIDGEEVATVDTLKESGTEADAQQKWFEKLDLDPGTHTIEVKLAGLSETAISQGATKPKIAFDYYEVTVAGEEPDPECTHENTVITGAKEATCTEAGYTGDTYCTDCETTIETGSVITATGHEMSGWTVTKEATCTEAGEKEKACANCDHTETEAIAATGHEMGDWTVTKEATCTEAGEKEKACANCDHTETEAIAATGHEMGDWTVTKEATCTEAGEKEKACANCDYTETEAIAATGHTYGEWTVVKEATEEETGLKERVCACGEKETEVIPKLEPTTPDQPDQPTTPEDPDEDKDGDSVATGDKASVVPFIIVMVIAVVAIVGILVIKKKRN